MSEHDAGGRETGSGNRVSRSVEEFVGQLRSFTDRARGAVPFSLPRLPSPPGALSAAQLRAIDRAVRSQRQQIAAMTAQLQAFRSEDDAGGRETGSGNRVSRSVEEFVGQLRSFTDRARGAVPFSLPRLPSPPGALSAAQLRAIDRAVRSQRQQIAAMTAQLQAFDEQLAVFERILDPLVEWSTTWARLEESVADLVRRPGDPDDGPTATPPPG